MMIFKKWCQEAYCDGVRETFESRKNPIGFMFWTTSMFIMVAATGFFMVRVVETYKMSPTATTYSTTSMSELIIPEVLLCFNGGLNYSLLKTANFSNDLILALSGAYLMGTMNHNLGMGLKIELDTYLNLHKISILEFYQQFGYQCEDIIEIVYPAGNSRLFQNVACKNVSQILSPFYGACWLLKDNGVQHEPGLNGGLRMYLKSPPDSVSIMLPDAALKSDRTLGFAVFIEKEFFIHTEKQYLIPANMKVEISLDAKHFLRLAQSKSSCNSSETFSSSNCFNRCFGDVFYEGCGCYPFRYYNPEADKFKKICDVFEEQLCRTFDGNKCSLCEHSCIPNCDEWIYDVTISYASSGSNLNKSYLWIGYDSMQYIKIEDVHTFTIEDAVANIGYQAGLWFGISIVTIIQGVYYLFLALLKEPVPSTTTS